LTLRGSLPSGTARDRILQQAHALYDKASTRIVDQLTVDEQVASAPWLDPLPEILPALGQMNGRGSIIIDGRSIVLSSRVANEQTKSALLHTIAPITAVGLELEDHVLAAAAVPTAHVPRASLQAQLNAMLSRATIEFNSNNATLTPSGRAALDRLIPTLKSAPLATIEIGGHTDGFGAPDYNIELSRRRAETVRHYLLKRGLTNQFTAVGYGATRPRSSEKTSAALQRNRRIEFHVKGNGDL
jgi:OOP family OmpA-OmpF porin